jgi:hypothetical protein
MESDLSSFVKQRHNFREALFLKKQKKDTRSLIHSIIILSL